MLILSLRMPLSFHCLPAQFQKWKLSPRFSFYGGSWRFQLIHLWCPTATWEEPGLDLCPIFCWFICLFTLICSKSAFKWRTLPLCPIANFVVVFLLSCCLTDLYSLFKFLCQIFILFFFMASGLYDFWVCHVWNQLPYLILRKKPPVHFSIIFRILEISGISRIFRILSLLLKINSDPAPVLLV